MNTTPEVVEMVQTWATAAAEHIADGLISFRVQFPVEGEGALTFFHNEKGAFIVEPNASPVPLDDWLAANAPELVRRQARS